MNTEFNTFKFSAYLLQVSDAILHNWINCHRGRLHKLNMDVCDVIKQNSRNSEILILSNSHTKETIFFVSYCFCNYSIAYIFGTNCLILMGFFGKM